MHRTPLALAALLALVGAPPLLLTGCATSASPSAATAGASRFDADADDAAVETDAAFAAALERAAGGHWEELRIDAGCRGKTVGWRSTVLFGSGVGIVGGERQFEVPREEILALLARFRAVGFAALPATIGGGGEEDAPLQAVCVLGVRIDGRSHRVQQLDRGERSAAMVALTEEVLELGDRAGADGVGVASLHSGLRQLVDHRLAAETLALTVNYRDVAGNGWLLNVEGARAVVQPLSADQGYGPPRPLDLDADAVGALAAELLANRFSELPINLYADGYLDLRVELLGHQHAVLAQRFAGMTATTHGEAQRRLAAVEAATRELVEKVLAQPAA